MAMGLVYMLFGTLLCCTNVVYGERFYDVEDSESTLRLISERDLFQGGDVGSSDLIEPLVEPLPEEIIKKPERGIITEAVTKTSSGDDVVFSVFEPPKPRNEIASLDARVLRELNVSNVVVNATADIQNKTIAVECELRTLPENEIASVIVANSSLLLNVLVASNRTNVTEAECAVILFFSSGCVFSARMAPHYNALARVFPGLAFYAVDTSLHNNIHVRYGIVSVPNVLLFHNAKPVSRFNDSYINLETLVGFIVRYTSLPYNGTLNVTSADMSGPVPAALNKRVDYMLIMAWSFTLFCFCFWFLKSSICHKIVECIRNTWIEAEAQHEHTD